MKLNPCPHCGSEVHLVNMHNGYAIVCNDKNCLCQMRVMFGSCDNKEIFLKKLISDWNKRSPEVRAVTAAIECIEEYRNTIYDETQEEYDDHGCCCVDVLDEVLNRLLCFTSVDAVEEWLVKAQVEKEKRNAKS